MDSFYRSLVAAGAWPPPGSRAAPLEWHLAHDAALPALAHPEMAVDAVQARAPPPWLLCFFRVYAPLGPPRCFASLGFTRLSAPLAALLL
jgi:hypothetical protein